jgi:phosphopantothenoylcysteine decarboxylase / phosphopantothenate---cysteine ligase
LHKRLAMHTPKILLIVGGGIAAYKACELVRLIRRNGGEVTCVLTAGGAQFITAMTLAALSENPVHTTLWDLANEVEMGHIQLSRAADLVVVCPATADLMARMAHGIADDLAATLLLATDKPVLAVPAMNVRMWEHAATRRNVITLRERGVTVMEPDEGPMACGEFGPGRLPEAATVWLEIARILGIGAETEPLLDFAAAPDLPESEDSGLGGLGADLIARSTPRGNQFLDLAFEQSDEHSYPEELPPIEPLPVPDLATGALLAKKGKAKAAPPTDLEAINHTVSDQAAPESALARLDESPPAPAAFAPKPDGPLTGRHVLITAGPTHEAIDPVRYIANRSSGKQGYAIAAAAALAGARVTLVSGPVSLATPPGVSRIDVESAEQMASAVKAALPADVAIMVAAVADWRVQGIAGEKIKKRGSAPPVLRLTENTDILATLAGAAGRPKLVIGFAAETEKVLDHAREKRKRKGADWIVANDVSGDVMGGDANTVHIVTSAGVESLPQMPKEQVAAALVERIGHALSR